MSSAKLDVFLGLDQALTTSGWCILANGTVHSHGVAKDSVQIQAVGDTLAQLVDGEWSRLLVALEHHGTHLLHGDKRWQRSPESIVTLGEPRGYWVHEVARRGHPKRLRILVAPGDWRMRVLGISNRAGTERCKATAIAWATQRALHPLADDNEAEAVCIAHWASFDGLAHNEARKQKQRVASRVRKAKSKQLEFGGRG